MTGGRSRGRPAGAPAEPFKPFPLPGLRAARLRAGETLQELGALLGVNKSHASKIELGQVRLDVERALVLARHYGLPVERFAIAEPSGDSVWLAQASSVLDVLEESAARAPGSIGNLCQYTTDSGLITCRALRAPFRFELALNGEPISRAHACELIAARMESRLS